jgi:hypothetical protein
MSALASLAGVECVECRKRGHHCQAQIWIDGEPLCLRCADDLPCYRETAPGFRDGFTLSDSEEVCTPTLPVQPVYRPKHENVLIMPEFDQSERCEIRSELEQRSVREVSLRHHLEISVVESLAKQMGVTANQQKKIAQVEAKIRQPLRHAQVQQRVRKPRAIEIKGETIRMAPGAQMGAEMIELKSRRITIKHIKELVGEHFGVEKDFDWDSRHLRNALLRHIVCYLSHVHGKYSYAVIGKFFMGRHHTTVFHSVQKIGGIMVVNAQLKKDVETLEAALDAGFTQDEKLFAQKSAIA